MRRPIRDLLRSAETLGACVAAIVAMAIWAASTWLATRWLNTTRLSPGEVAHAFTGMGLICALRFVENIYVGSIIGLQRQVAQCIVSCSVMSARAFGSVAVLALLSPTLDAFFAWQVLISLISIPAYAILVYRSLPPGTRPGKFSWSTVTGIWRFSGGVIANAVLALLLLQPGQDTAVGAPAAQGVLLLRGGQCPEQRPVHALAADFRGFLSVLH